MLRKFRIYVQTEDGWYTFLPGFFTSALLAGEQVDYFRRTYPLHKFMSMEVPNG